MVIPPSFNISQFDCLPLIRGSVQFSKLAHPRRYIWILSDRTPSSHCGRKSLRGRHTDWHCDCMLRNTSDGNRKARKADEHIDLAVVSAARSHSIATPIPDTFDAVLERKIRVARGSDEVGVKRMQ